jgi:hypothetical protein
VSHGVWPIPSRSQWRQWSVPSRLTAIGTLVGVLSLGLYLAEKGFGIFRFWSNTSVESSGVLTPTESPSTVSPVRRVEIGHSEVFLDWNGASGEAFLTLEKDTRLIIETINGRLLISTKLRDRSGALVAEVVRNEWQTAKPRIFDANYSADAFEVRDDRGEVVLQIEALADRIRIQGEWYLDNGCVFVMMESDDPRRPNEALLSPCAVKTVDSHHITPLFKYPSARHLGETIPWHK